VRGVKGLDEWGGVGIVGIVLESPIPPYVTIHTKLDSLPYNGNEKQKRGKRCIVVRMGQRDVVG